MYEKDKYTTKERQYNSIEGTGKTGMLKKIDNSIYESRKERTKTIVEHSAMPRMSDDVIEKLNFVSSDVIGNIFDRVRFLEERIAEINGNIDVRKQLHEGILKDIEKDIDDKNAMCSVMSDPNERRNLKLDVSVLRKEKRHEDVQFWKDLVELTTEMKKLVEQHETEKKIS